MHSPIAFSLPVIEYYPLRFMMESHKYNVISISKKTANKYSAVLRKTSYSMLFNV